MKWTVKLSKCINIDGNLVDHIICDSVRFNKESGIVELFNIGNEIPIYIVNFDVFYCATQNPA